MQKIDLKDMTFLLAVKLDHQDRMENLEICYDFLTKNFDTNIIIGEEDDTPKLQGKFDCPYVFVKQESDGIMRRMKVYNAMLDLVQTPYMSLYDVDVIFPIRQFNEMMDLLRGNKADFVYPYQGKFLDVPRQFKDIFIEDVDKLDMAKLILNHPNSIGGAISFKTQVFKDGGCGNENIIGLGYCDNEMNARFSGLGYRQGRTSGHCFHLEHFRSKSCYGQNPYGHHNGYEYSKVQRMPLHELREYVKTIRK